MAMAELYTISQMMLLLDSSLRINEQVKKIGILKYND